MGFLAVPLLAAAALQGLALPGPKSESPTLEVGWSIAQLTCTGA